MWRRKMDNSILGLLAWLTPYIGRWLTYGVIQSFADFTDLEIENPLKSAGLFLSISYDR